MKISASSSGELEKCEYLTGKDLEPIGSNKEGW